MYNTVLFAVRLLFQNKLQKMKTIKVYINYYLYLKTNSLTHLNQQEYKLYLLQKSELLDDYSILVVIIH